MTSETTRLVLKRKPGQAIRIGDSIIVRRHPTKCDALIIEAPADVRIERPESKPESTERAAA